MKKRVNGGKERTQKVRKVRVHEGSDGCSAAHESEVMSGWAPDVRGAMLERAAGRLFSLPGKRVGEIKGLEAALGPPLALRPGYFTSR